MVSKVGAPQIKHMYLLVCGVDQMGLLCMSSFPSSGTGTEGGGMISETHHTMA